MCIILYYNASYCITLYNLLYYTILYCTLLKHTVIHYTVVYYTILYYSLLYCTILYYTIFLYPIILNCTILYYTVLYCTVLCSAILIYTVLYYTRLYHTALYLGRPRRPPDAAQRQCGHSTQLKVCGADATQSAKGFEGRQAPQREFPGAAPARYIEGSGGHQAKQLSSSQLDGQPTKQLDGLAARSKK